MRDVVWDWVCKQHASTWRNPKHGVSAWRTWRSPKRPAPLVPLAYVPPPAGMVTTDWQKFREYKANGLVKDVFSNQEKLDSLKGE